MKFPEKLKGDNKGIPEYSIIKPNDFFAQSFEGMHIPKNKINRVLNRIVSKRNLVTNQEKSIENMT